MIKTRPPVCALDFDGTVCTNKFPDIGEILPKHERVIDYVRHLKDEGWTIVLWTCREDLPERAYLTEAVNWCREHDIPIDHANNYYQAEYMGYVSRKINAEIFIDDKALHIDDIPNWRLN
jgi:2-hydroxy-3-keto-5-methylthiopentenyl-1-phosphate phosphatase